jgi:hypothetical protein
MGGLGELPGAPGAAAEPDYVRVVPLDGNGSVSLIACRKESQAWTIRTARIGQVAVPVRPGGLAVMDAVQDASADGGTPPGRGRQQRVARLALAGIGGARPARRRHCLGALASRPAPPAWQPGSINNLVLQAGPAVVADGNDYPAIATRGEDPAPLSTGELARAFPPGSKYGPSQVSADCAGAVTGAGRPVCQRRAPAAAAEHRPWRLHPALAGNSRGRRRARSRQRRRR